MLNIMDLKTGQVLLGMDVDNWIEAYGWLDHYRVNYGRDVPYPNGLGEYEGEYVICRRCCELCNIYYVIQ